MKRRTQAVILILALAVLPYLSAYLLAIESGYNEPLAHAFIIYSIFLAAGFISGVVVCILSFGITPFKQLK